MLTYIFEYYYIAKLYLNLKYKMSYTSIVILAIIVSIVSLAVAYRKKYPNVRSEDASQEKPERDGQESKPVDTEKPAEEVVEEPEVTPTEAPGSLGLSLKKFFKG